MNWWILQIRYKLTSMTSSECVAHLVLTLGVFTTLQGLIFCQDAISESNGDLGSDVKIADDPIVGSMEEIMAVLRGQQNILDSVVTRLETVDDLKNLLDSVVTRLETVDDLKNQVEIQTSNVKLLLKLVQGQTNKMVQLTKMNEENTNALTAQLVEQQKDMISQLINDNRDMKIQIEAQNNIVTQLSNDNTDIKLKISELHDVSADIKHQIITQTSLVSEVSKSNADLKDQLTNQATYVAKMSSYHKNITAEIVQQTNLIADTLSNSKVKTQIVKQTSEIAEKINIFSSQFARENENSHEFEMALISKVDGMTSVFEELTSQVEGLANYTKNVHADVFSNTCANVQSPIPRPVVNLGDGMRGVCDTTTDNGGWLVFQRRASADVDFFRTWDEYKSGFGQLHGNFWLGLDIIHRITQLEQHELRVDITYNGTSFYANYDNFTVLGEEDNYMLLISGYSGDAGDHLWYHGEMGFSTWDRDNDVWPHTCASYFRGAWWYRGCLHSNLNGLWNITNGDSSALWGHEITEGSSAHFTEMKMRPVH